MLESKRIKALMSLHYGTDSVAINTGNASQRLTLTSDVVEAFKDLITVYPNEVDSESLKRVLIELLEDYFKDYIEENKGSCFEKDAFYRIEALFGMQGWQHDKHYIGVIRDIFGIDFRFKDHLQDHLLTDELIASFACLFGVTTEWLRSGSANGDMFTHNTPKNTIMNDSLSEGSPYFSGFASEIDFHIVKSRDPQGAQWYYAFQILRLSGKEDGRVIAKSINPIAYVDETHIFLLSDPILNAVKDSQMIKAIDLDYADFKALVTGASSVWSSNVENESKKVKLKDIKDLVQSDNELIGSNHEQTLLGDNS